MIFWKDKAAIVEYLCRREGATSEGDTERKSCSREQKGRITEIERGGKKRTGKRQAASGVQSV